MVNRSSAIPPWEQLRDLLKARIESGEWPPGTRVPALLRLAAEYEVAVNTARKALAALQREGLIETRTGWGTFVSGG